MPNSSYRNTPRKHLNKGFTKKGSKAAGTDGAHKLSHRVVQARYDTLEHCRLASCPADTLPRTSAPRSRSQAKGIKSHSAGRPVTQSKPGMVKAINSSSNIRIKSKHGNRTLVRLYTSSCFVVLRVVVGHISWLCSARSH